MQKINYVSCGRAFSTTTFKPSPCVETLQTMGRAAVISGLTFSNVQAGLPTPEVARWTDTVKATNGIDAVLESSAVMLSSVTLVNVQTCLVITGVQ